MRRNIWRLLEGSPDAVALLLLAHQRETGCFPKDSDALCELTSGVFSTRSMEDCLPLAFPPLLRASLDVLIRASAELPGLIAPGSWLDSAANSPYIDGPWAVWRQENAGQLAGKLHTGPAPKVLSLQRAYAAIKRAIARNTTRDVQSISADDRLDELFVDRPDPIPGILDSVAMEMPDIRLRLDKRSLVQADRVRDLARDLIDEAEELDPSQAASEPDIRMPDWLVTMVRDRAGAEGSDFDPVAIARMAGVPLSSVLRAAKSADVEE
ncbi:MAG: hypothetical protein RQ750_09525 [Roseovarius sp.]|nr:hypothetical protein [Roseovarius sp.]